MIEVFPIVYLARHGETAWTVTGQDTGLTDLPLTERGERNARRLAERLRGVSIARVFISPLQRATRTTFIVLSLRFSFLALFFSSPLFIWSQIMQPFWRNGRCGTIQNP
jgi:bisphosphoglycerate-dependent phosphoglycerate mutase